jgi:hypothetical protein
LFSNFPDGEPADDEAEAAAGATPDGNETEASDDQSVETAAEANAEKQDEADAETDVAAEQAGETPNTVSE